jgi:hypothetical protein
MLKNLIDHSDHLAVYRAVFLGGELGIRFAVTVFDETVEDTVVL